MAAIGRVLLMSKGTYSGSAIYNALDWVRYDGKAWVCKIDGTQGVTPVEGANWTLMAADGSVTGSVVWANVTGKPFESVDSSDFEVDANDELNIKRDTFGTMKIVSGGTTTNLKASGDSTFEIDAGTNVTITADDSANPKKITINSTGGGGGSYTASKGVKLVGSDIRADLKSDTAGSLSAASKGSTADREYAVGIDSNNNLSVNIPWVEPSNGQLTIMQNGAVKANFTADQVGNASASIVTGHWHSANATVSSGQVSFTVDDTGTKGYEVFFNITSNSVNKNPYATINTISGEGTSSCTIVYDTDADNGSTAKLWINEA